MNLTDKKIKKIPTPQLGRETITDGQGLQLRITSKNIRTWSWQYRYNNRMLKMTIGQWPAINCLKARKIADGYRFQLAQGLDPQSEKQKAKTEKLTFEEAWMEFDLRHIEVNNKPKTQKEYRRNAAKDILPTLGKIALKDIKRHDIVSLLRKLSKHALTMTNRTQALLNSFFNWCVSIGYLEVNPATGIPKAKKEKGRDHVLSFSDMRAIYSAASQLSAGNQLFVKLLLLTGQREAVISQLNVSEVEEDHLNITGERNKSGSLIKIHLACEARRLIKDLGCIEGPFVVSTTKGHRPISGFSKIKNKLVEVSGVSGWRFHDFRRGIATYLEENGLDRIYTERLLNHKDRSVTGIYARPEHREHLQKVLEQWSLVLTSKDGFDANNLVQFAR